MYFDFFFFNDTATTEIYTLSLHDALPIYLEPAGHDRGGAAGQEGRRGGPGEQALGQDDARAGLEGRHGLLREGEPHPVPGEDRKSTRLNSSHANISYAVFCLKKKKKYSML